MKQTGPPARKTPLGPGSKPLKRGGPIARDPERARQRQDAAREKTIAEARSGTVLPKKRVKAKPEVGSADREPAKRPAPRQTGPNSKTRRTAGERDGGLCVRCHQPATNLQHREGRGSGGRGKADAARTNSVEWLLSLCGMGNASGCHAWCDEERALAEEHGYVIRRNGPPVDATTVPVLTFRGWELFLADGTRQPTTSPYPKEA